MGCASSQQPPTTSGTGAGNDPFDDKNITGTPTTSTNKATNTSVFGGNKRKPTITELRERVGSSQVSSTNSLPYGGIGGGIGGNGGSSNNANKNVDEVAIEQFANSYCDRVRPKDQFNNEIKRENIVSDCLHFFRTWPRGEGPGALLPEPIPDTSTKLEDRGVKVLWLMAAWTHLRASTKKMFVPTRAFADVFVHDLLLKHNAKDLYEFIPLAYRKKADVYICHGWDGWFRQIMFLSEITIKDWPADPAVWIDIFAINLSEKGPNTDLIKPIQDVIMNIGKTLVVFPGDGSPDFAVLPIHRSWCLFEIACTPVGKLQTKIGLHGDLGDVAFHKAVAEKIDNFSIAHGKSTYDTDKKTIDKLLPTLSSQNGNPNVDELVKQLCRDAFAERYANVTSPDLKIKPTNKPGLGRFSSLSDVYDDDRKTNSEKNLDVTPDF
jgi:hypothetical protein